MFISIYYVCVLYNTIKWPFPTKHSPSCYGEQIASSLTEFFPGRLICCRNARLKYKLVVTCVRAPACLLRVRLYVCV